MPNAEFVQNLVIDQFLIRWILQIAAADLDVSPTISLRLQAVTEKRGAWSSETADFQGKGSTTSSERQSTFRIAIFIL